MHQKPLWLMLSIFRMEGRPTSQWLSSLHIILTPLRTATPLALPSHARRATMPACDRAGACRRLSLSSRRQTSCGSQGFFGISCPAVQGMGTNAALGLWSLRYTEKTKDNKGHSSGIPDFFRVLSTIERDKQTVEKAVAEGTPTSLRHHILHCRLADTQGTHMVLHEIMSTALRHQSCIVGWQTHKGLTWSGSLMTFRRSCSSCLRRRASSGSLSGC